MVLGLRVFHCLLSLQKRL